VARRNAAACRFGALTAPSRQEGAPLPELPGRRRAVPVALILATILLSSLSPVTQSATTPPTLEPFLYALGEVESGGNYYARNSVTGAYGKYQIMPSNWPAWAGLYLGDSSAPQTPTNQEIVAHKKVTALYWWLDSWPTVAHWWLTGSSERNPAYWSSTSRYYVTKVITLMNQVIAGQGAGGAPAPTGPPPVGVVTTTTLRVADNSKLIAYRGSWSLASLSSYQGGQVHYSSTDGATASLVLDGKSLSWIGPVGPTRGRARVWIDGRAVATVDLRRTDFKARVSLYSISWPSSGHHTFRIEVLGSGRPVAIDELVVTRR
jgi:hypothetical protein